MNKRLKEIRALSEEPLTLGRRYEDYLKCEKSEKKSIIRRIRRANSPLYK